MRIHRTVTEVGQGVWNSETHELALLSERRVYRNLAGTREETVCTFLLASRKGPETPWNWHRFGSAELRLAFLDDQVKLRSLRAADEQPEERGLLDVYHPAQELIESVVWTVSFIGEYLSLEFDAGKLEVYDWPRYLERGVTRAAGEPGYRNTLWDLIDRCVTGVDECLDAGLVVRFLGGAALHVPLGEGGPLAKPAAATFRRHGGDVYVWQRGEAPFVEGTAA